MRTEKVTEYLQYHFTSDELLEIARETSRTLNEKRILEDKKSEIAKTLAGDIAAKQAQIDKLSGCIASGYEWRNIECVLRYDSPRPGLVELVRTDTGEIVKHRRMTDGELQMQLELKVASEEGVAAEATHDSAKAPDYDSPEWRTDEEIRAGVPFKAVSK